MTKQHQSNRSSKGIILIVSVVAVIILSGLGYLIYQKWYTDGTLGPAREGDNLFSGRLPNGFPKGDIPIYSDGKILHGIEGVNTKQERSDWVVVISTKSSRRLVEAKVTEDLSTNGWTLIQKSVGTMTQIVAKNNDYGVSALITQSSDGSTRISYDVMRAIKD